MNHIVIRSLGALALGTFVSSAAWAQCENKSGFAKKLCEAQQGRGGAAGASGLPDFGDNKTNALTTNFADTIHLDTLPPTVEPKAFKPLTSLERSDDGAFILKSGIYEAYLQSYTLDAGDVNLPKAGGYYPAPIKGRRAKIVASLLKESELHPDVLQNEIQQLLFFIVQGMDLEKMPPAFQQTAMRVMSKESLRQLQGAAMAGMIEKSILDIINQRISKDKNAQKVIGQMNDAEKQAQQNAAAAPADFTTGFAEPVQRGTWAQMPGGFYVRYLPDGYMKTRLQVIVPDAAIAAVSGKSALTFDPTQFLAVLAGSPPERIGITLRPVR
jgi:hypothetical protein